MQPIQYAGSQAGNIVREVTKPDQGTYGGLRALDLQYAIEWNRRAGKKIPAPSASVLKDDLVKYCELYKIDLDICSTYIDTHNTIRIARPPVAPPAPVEELLDDTADLDSTKTPEEMTFRALKRYLKTNGYVVSDDIRTKEGLLAIWNSGLPGQPVLDDPTS